MPVTKSHNWVFYVCFYIVLSEVLTFNAKRHTNSATRHFYLVNHIKIGIKKVDKGSVSNHIMMQRKKHQILQQWMNCAFKAILKIRWKRMKYLNVYELWTNYRSDILDYSELLIKETQLCLSRKDSYKQKPDFASYCGGHFENPKVHPQIFLWTSYITV